MKRLITTTTILLTIVGIIAPIVWSTIEKRISLSVNLLSATPIVGIKEETIRDDLVVTFRGNKISNLVKYEFGLVNTSNQPLDVSVVKIFPTIKIPKNIVVLQAIISHTSPPGIDSKLIQSESPSNIVIEFDLLNQGDSIFVTLYADGELVNKLEIAGRIVGLKEVEFNDYSGPSANEKIIGGYERYQEIVSPIFDVIFCGFIILILTNFSFPRKKQRNRLLKNTELLTSLNSKQELVDFIYDFLDFYPNFIKKSLANQVNTSNIDDKEVLKILHYKISKYLLKLAKHEIPMLIGALIGAVSVTVVAFMKLMA